MGFIWILIFFQIISKLSCEFLAPKEPSSISSIPTLSRAPHPGDTQLISAVRTGFPGNCGISDPCLKTTGHHRKLPRNAGNVNGSLTQTGALPLWVLLPLIRLQNSLWKVPLSSAPAWVCHLPSSETWWPQPDLDALIPCAVNGWCLKDTLLISPQPCFVTSDNHSRLEETLCYLHSEPAQQLSMFSLGTSISDAEVWRFALQIAYCGDISPLGAEPEASSLARTIEGETHFVVKLSEEERQEGDGKKLDHFPLF